jgi:hypothetical protein
VVYAKLQTRAFLDFKRSASLLTPTPVSSTSVSEASAEGQCSIALRGWGAVLSQRDHLTCVVVRICLL